MSQLAPVYIEWDNRISSSSFFWSIEFIEAECHESLTLSNAATNSQSFEAQTAITSSQSISGSNTTVDYKAGNEITLLADFEVALGAMFRAYIDGCTNQQLKSSEGTQK